MTSYKSIPYAAAPVGAGRWKPTRLIPFHSINNGHCEFSASPMQEFSQDEKAFFYKTPMDVSEDCLYLNIWTPDQEGQHHPDHTDATKYPVMVWIYGGGLLSGSSADPLYDGNELSKKGVVVVTFNYRLGVFGYFSHPALSDESSHQVSGNYGLLDQIQALKWVQKNITYFGGDPNNVTIFGESAGALSISQLLVSPLALGLFHKSILQSAYLPAMPDLKKPVFGMQSAEDYGVSFCESLGVSGSSLKVLEKMRAIPADVLLEAASAFEFDKAVVDGWSLPYQIFESFENGYQHNIPMIAGFNSHEGSYFPQIGLITAPTDESDYIKTVKKRYGDLAEDYLAVYLSDDLYRAAYAPLGDGLYAWGTERLAALMARRRNDVYLYYFSHIPAWFSGSNIGAVHSSEIPFVFNIVKNQVRGCPSWPNIPSSNEDVQMADIISDYWVSFAKDESPSVLTQPDWRSYNDTNKYYMEFAEAKAELKSNLLSDALSLHEKIVNNRRERGMNWTYNNIGLLAARPVQ